MQLCEMGRVNGAMAPSTNLEEGGSGAGAGNRKQLLSLCPGHLAESLHCPINGWLLFPPMFWTHVQTYVYVCSRSVHSLLSMKCVCLSLHVHNTERRPKMGRYATRELPFKCANRNRISPPDSLSTSEISAMDPKCCFPGHNK